MSNLASTQILGAIVGATAGAARNGLRDYRRVQFYEPIPARMISNEGFDSWLVWAEHLREGKAPEAIGQTRGDELRLRSIEATFGDVNIRAGIYPPFSGNFRHPLPSSANVWLRAMYWGLVCPPHMAAIYAYWDVECDQGSENAVIAATLIAGLQSAGPIEWLRRMIGLVERVSAAKQVLRLVAALTTEGYSATDIHKRIQGVAESHDPFDAVLNLGYIATSVLSGQGDFAKTLTVAMGCGGACSSNSAYVGALVAGWKRAVPAEWLEPLGNDFVPAGSLLRVESPETVAKFTEKCVENLPKLTRTVPYASPVEAIAVEDPTTGYITELESDDPLTGTEPPEPLQPVIIPAVESGSCVYCLENLLVTVTYDDLPVVQPDRTIRCLVTVEATHDDVILKPIVHTPPDWTLAHRLVSCRIAAGTKQTFPLVVQPGASEGPALIQLGERFIPIVAVLAQSWYLTGPFPNFDGFGFEKPLRCEDILSESEVFAGRGELATKWRRKSFPGITFDLEPFFMEGPGILCLYGKIEFPASGRYKVVVSGSPGALVKVDRRVLIRYMDTHQPIRRPMAPYVADFDSPGVNEIFIRVARHLEPASPLSIYFLNVEGQVVMPSRTLPIGS